ncbi:MAG: hypothetical protein EOO04_18620 [Chitinophagaceae bacterium]|nr:MAG: hypothetical protein EOO04_18620 [Chitinophagaceae bacterium]
MRKLIPVLLFSFSGTIAFSQTSTDRNTDNKENSFAESLRLEIVTGIKKKMATDTVFQQSQQVMGDFYKACGLTPSIQKCAHPEPGKNFKSAPEALTATLNEINRSIATKKDQEGSKEN